MLPWSDPSRDMVQIHPQMEQVTACYNDVLVWYCHLDDSNPFVDTTDAVVNWKIRKGFSRFTLEQMFRHPLKVPLHNNNNNNNNMIYKAPNP